VFVVKHWADRWDAYVKVHPELLGAEREIMKAGFDNMQAAEMSKEGKAHFSLVMNFLRLAGRHEIGTWKGYVPATGTPAAVSESPAGNPCTTRYRQLDVAEFILLAHGILERMGDETIETFERDIAHLWAKSGCVSVQVQWEENGVYLEGSADSVAGAKAELALILKCYFPTEPGPLTLPSEPSVCDVSSRQPDAQPKAAHWAESAQMCTLSKNQKRKTLAETQAAREKQRGAVKHWADRWEEWVKINPELIGAERETMKAGFDAMQVAEAGQMSKAHFSLVMNFLRQSGRRTIGAWKDYTPKNWVSQ